MEYLVERVKGYGYKSSFSKKNSNLYDFDYDYNRHRNKYNRKRVGSILMYILSRLHNKKV
jgi:hypothetical protein